MYSRILFGLFYFSSTLLAYIWACSRTVTPIMRDDMGCNTPQLPTGTTIYSAMSCGGNNDRIRLSGELTDQVPTTSPTECNGGVTNQASGLFFAISGVVGKEESTVTCCLCHSTLDQDFTLNVYTADCASGDLQCAPDTNLDEVCVNPDGTETSLPKAIVPGSNDDLMFVYISAKSGQHGVFNFTLHCQDMDLEEDFDTARRDYYNYVKRSKRQVQ